MNLQRIVEKFSGDIAVVIRLRTGCRGEAPAWGQRPHHPFVLTELATAIFIEE
jgi:hypothetical protein